MYRKTSVFYLLALLTQVNAFAQPDVEAYPNRYYAQLFELSADNICNTFLYEVIEEWLGIPYLYGGKNKKGIDCSSLTAILYDKAYNISLAKSARDIFKEVFIVEKSKLQEGDLLFFKISNNQISHVGIYLTQNKFVHASRRSGVTISNLNEPYYKKYFYAAGRHKIFDKNQRHDLSNKNLNTEQNSN